MGVAFLFFPFLKMYFVFSFSISIYPRYSLFYSPTIITTPVSMFISSQIWSTLFPSIEMIFQYSSFIFLMQKIYNILINFPMLHKPCISGINMAFLYLLTSLIFSLGFFYFRSWEIYLYFFFLLISYFLSFNILSFAVVRLHWPGNMSWEYFLLISSLEELCMIGFFF